LAAGVDVDVLNADGLACCATIWVRERDDQDENV